VAPFYFVATLSRDRDNPKFINGAYSSMPVLHMPIRGENPPGRTPQWPKTNLESNAGSVC
jgi:hypothetical protein